jgi:DNA polymerase-3 subunit chi
MTEIGFYHLTQSTLDQALPRLLDKILAAGKKAVVRAGSEERVAFLNTRLWTYDAASFLPHGSAAEGDGAEHPIWLTTGDDNPNDADILILTDGARPGDVSGFARCLEMFDGRDDAAVTVARARWKSYKEEGYTLAYWQQSEGGGWSQMAQG